MFLALDIGNTRVKCGLFDGSVIRLTFEMESRPDASVASYRHSLRVRLGDYAPTAIGISSVVPRVAGLVAQAARDEFMVLPTIVDQSLDFPFGIDYDPPEALGADRICAAAAAYRKYAAAEAGSTRPVIVVDVGTASTFEVVDRGYYRGGAIAPGPGLAVSALEGGTAGLKKFVLSLPDSPIGRSSSEGVSSGILYGLIDSVSGMIARLSEECEGVPVVVATGGWGQFVTDHIPAVGSYEPHLVLEGIRLLVAESQT